MNRHADYLIWGLIIFAVLSILFFFTSCHSVNVARFTNKYFPPTDTVEIFTDITLIPYEYIELGYVEASGGITVSKDALLKDMIDEAKRHGANALIKLEFWDTSEYNPTLGSISKPSAKAIMIVYK